ncbi:hypothetical protein C0991_008496 [Blastosporella zonata]|nr:hypothetical protein C0991_008496 [Blastosporella zonata]
MAHLALPFDITADIIFHLRGDVVTLLQSCQVCRTFLVPSRKALSAVIAFDTAIYSSGLTISPNYPYDDSKIDATHRRWNQLYAYLMSEGSIERLVWFHPQSRSGAFVESLWFMKRLQSLVLIVSEQEEIDAAFNFFKRGAIPDSLKEIYLYIDDPDGILSTYACHYYIDQTLGDTVAIYGRRDVRIVYLRRVKTLDERSVAMMKRYFPQLSSQARLSVYEEDMETFERSMRAMMRGQEIIFSPSR